MPVNIQESLQKRAYLIEQQELILNESVGKGRNMTPDEHSKFQNMDKDIVALEQSIEAAQAFAKRTGQTDEYAKLDQQFNHVPVQNAGQNNTFSFGEELIAVANSYKNGIVDSRLNNVKMAASGHSANVPSDGGFLIQPTKASEIFKRVYEGGEIASRCATYEVGPNSDSFEVPYLDETSRANGSRWGGLRAYREGEVDPATSSKTKIGQWECRLTDIKALVYVTDRLLQDAPALESFIMEALPQEFQFKLEDEILSGTGGIQCKGFIGDPATVSVAKETGQVAATIQYENILKMWSRAWGRGRQNSVWAINQDCEPQLWSMVMATGVGGVPVFMPPGGISGSPYSTLFNRPVITIEQASTLGTVGDIILADMSQYALVRKGGLNQASSIHVRFIYDEMTFKFNMRVNGKPKWKSALTPFKGNNTLSPFVTLDTR